MKLVGRKRRSPRFVHRAEPFTIAAANASRQSLSQVPTRAMISARTRRRIEGAFGSGALDQTCAGSTPVMPRLKRALELAVREAGERPLSPSEVLVGLASVGDGVAARILADQQISLDALRAKLADRAG
jgi:hypothetical protein